MPKEGTDLIWVKKEFAERYNNLKSDEAQIEAFNEYLKTVEKASRAEFKTNFENLEEDVAIYKDLMLNVKQAFEKAKGEQLQASYDVWEKFDKDMPNIKEKTNKIIDALSPLTVELNKINDLLNKIQTYDFVRLIETVEKFSRLYGESKEMVEFLVNNFTPKREAPNETK